MKKIFLLIIMPVVMVLAYTSSAHAVGIGVYGSFSYTNAYYEDISNSSINFDLLHYFAGGGLVIDTAVAKKQLFNYRMNLGVGQIWDKTKNMSFSDAGLGFQVEFINSFGFGIVKIPFLRLWLGPQLGLKFAHRAVNSIEDFDIDRLIFAPGAVLGLNFNIGSFFTISVDGGFRYNLGLTFETYGTDAMALLNDRVYSGLGPEGFVNLSIIFRINDNYARPDKPESSQEKNKENTTDEKGSGEKKSGDKVQNDDDYWYGD